MKTGQKRVPKTVYVKTIPIGGFNPVVIQTMWKKPLTTISPHLLEEINSLKELGCGMLRFAVPDDSAAGLVGSLANSTDMPIVADIHFDYRLALRCLDYSIAKIRINPGNIGASWKVKEVVGKAKDKQVPIRIGVNSGSLPAKYRKKLYDGKNNHTDDGRETAKAMVETAESEVELLSALDFDDIIVSLKSTDIETTIEANRIFAEHFPYPLHVGITEAGPLISGTVRNTIGIATLLREGIGSTIRVSLSEPPETEVITAREILSATKLRKQGVTIVSCPMCGRASFDVQGFIHRLERELYTLTKTITVAVMGCVVNGPGEAKQADLGISGTKDGAVIFKKGAILRRVPLEEAYEVFRNELYTYKQDE